MNLRVGEIVGVRVLGVVGHVGIVTERGSIISNSMRGSGVIEQTQSEFSEGKRILRMGYPGNLPASIVLERARSKLGERWSLLTSNCEHFVRWAHGLKPTSPQLMGSAVVVALAVMFVLRSK